MEKTSQMLKEEETKARRRKKMERLISRLSKTRKLSRAV
jgi:hypothetical protein